MYSLQTEKFYHRDTEISRRRSPSYGGQAEGLFRFTNREMPICETHSALRAVRLSFKTRFSRLASQIFRIHMTESFSFSASPENEKKALLCVLCVSVVKKLFCHPVPLRELFISVAQQPERSVSPGCPPRAGCECVFRHHGVP